MVKKDVYKLKYDKLSPEEIKKMSPKEMEFYMLKQRPTCHFDTGVGWSPLEAALFYLVVSKYGVGQWEKAQYFLPHKNTAQINVFCQKLYGQQSLAAFSNLKLCPYEHYVVNALNPNKIRKSGVVVHSGPALTNAQKKQQKIKNGESQILLNVDLPIIEDRSRNYNKLFRQMDRLNHQIEDELKSRGEDVWEKAKGGDQKLFNGKVARQFLEPLTKWPRYTKWTPGEELKICKGQDNPYPQIRLCEDDEWLAGDQCFHWKFMGGEFFDFMDKKFPKKGAGRAYIPEASKKKRWAKHKSCDYTPFSVYTGRFRTDVADSFKTWFEGKSQSDPKSLLKRYAKENHAREQKHDVGRRERHRLRKQANAAEAEVTIEDFAKFVNETKFIPSPQKEKNKKKKAVRNSTSSSLKDGKSHYKGVFFNGHAYFAKRFCQCDGEKYAPPGKTFANEMEAALYSDKCVDLIRKKFPGYNGQKNFISGPPTISTPLEKKSFKMNKCLYSWSTDELCSWLTEHDFPSDVLQNLRKAKVTGRNCLHLEEEEFDKLGITVDGGNTPWSKVLHKAVCEYGTGLESKKRRKILQS